jgi:hypothetical protein
LSGLSDFTKAENSSDFTRAENWAEGVSDFDVWDIGQVTVSNFDWLPFTPLWLPSPVLQHVRTHTVRRCILEISIVRGRDK